jgi:hypothetical protein
MPKTFNPDTEIPDLSGKVIVVTGGTYLQLLTVLPFVLIERTHSNSAIQLQYAKHLERRRMIHVGGRP